MKAIVITRGRIATVDDEDFDRVNQFKWHALKRASGTYYGVRNIILSSGRKTLEYLHHFISGKKGIDHRDGDGLNNQKKNLRSATQLQNTRGRRRKSPGKSSRFRGVSWRKDLQKWGAHIGVSGRLISLGKFLIEEDAARAYDAAARKYFGRFAAPNFP